jgi:DNA-binding transcriptional ArsR family regulator
MSMHHPDREELDVSVVLHALSDPQRLRIVKKLAQSETPCACGGFGLDITKSTLTHHFRVLREAGVISQHVVGTSKLNSLRRDDLNARFPGLLDAVLAATPAQAAAHAA